ncbi:MAG: ABC transporter substrate-binding protein [Leptospiraceae bacterium]|nr:ABC transporter substrate-binding protein [Leptospiraceae bacterium]MBP9164118.1 ABC transporter substrate-binding protein [Leptospiraceae bacterium]HRG46838.1 ABC transporter substrate-binding protein [Leptospiraceae bacterium]HRG77237.1 ABC transporter substrate-binding protein [Leptospiraceae bacterium]
MSKKLFSLSLLFCFLTSSVLFADESTILPTAKKLVGFIRFKKNDQAIALIDTKTFSKNLLLNHWDKIDPKDQLEFEEAMKEYIKHKSFPIALQYFDKIDINYEKAKVKGKEAELPASILYKGSEKITFSWIFTETNGKFLVSDFLLAEGKLASEVNRVKQIEPTYEKKGMKELIALIKKASK